jgi:small GTP-binding protein
MKKKVVILGHFGVGKTSLTHRFVKKHFSDKYLSTIGVSIQKKVIELTKDENIQLIIWDVAGEHNINLINKSYLKGAHGYIFVVDLTREETYKNIKEDICYLNDIMKQVPFLTIGNKLDLVTLDEANEIKATANLDYLCSAKTGENVDEFFKDIAVRTIHE